MVTLQQLKYFCELARTQQLTKTAEALSISQSTLSNTIISLEKQLGVQLFDRVGRSIQLNDLGREYYSYANEALVCLQNAQGAVENFKSGAQAKVTLALENASIWTTFVHDFCHRYKDYSISQVDCSCDSFRPALFNQETDFAIAGVGDFPMDGLNYEILREDDLYLCVPQNHPLAGEKSVHLAQLRNESVIRLPKSTGFRRFCDNLLKTAGVKYQSSIECDSVMRGRLVEAGFGIAITTKSGFRQHLLGDNVLYIPISDDYSRRVIALFWNPRRRLSRAAEDMKKFFVDYMHNA